VVDDSLLVAIDERMEKLLEDGFGFLLLEGLPIALNHILEEIHSLDELQHDVGIVSLREVV